MFFGVNSISRTAMWRNVVLIFFAVIATFQFAVAEQVDPDLDAKTRKLVVGKIAELLNENYVFIEVAEQCGSHISSLLGKGEFDNLTSTDAFARRLTDELQSISHDRHMRVRVRDQALVNQEMGDPDAALAIQLRRARERNFGFERVERLPGNIGYIDFREFAPVDLARGTAAAALAFVANSDALIFDMRKNGGGSPGMVQYICSYLFDKGVHLNSLYWRRGDRTDEFWTLDQIDGTRMPEVPVFVLTSRRTFSGAEEFTYNLQTRDRATIVGETTGGGANPGGAFPINADLNIFIPTGRAINPVTRTNWEGVGVNPDVETSAEEALTTALSLAKNAAIEFRETRIAQEDARRRQLREKLQEAEILLEKKESLKGRKIVNEALTEAVDGGELNEARINQMGYNNLQAGSVELAIEIFKFNVDRYPESPNVYDSLGDGYDASGQFERARSSYETAYKKGLALDDPNTQAFRANLERLEKKIKNP